MTSFRPAPSPRLIPDPRPAAERIVVSRSAQTLCQSILPTTEQSNPIVHELSRIAPQDRQHVMSLIHALIETLQGRRPLPQLDRWAFPDVVATIGHLQRAGRDEPLVFRSVRLQTRSATVIEVTVNLIWAGRSRAAAMKLIRTRAHDRWVCSRFETALWSPVITRAA